MSPCIPSAHSPIPLVRFGDCAHTAVELTAGIRDPKERSRRLTNIIKAMSRFFWFTVEFGLMRGPNGICAYGSGLLSSFGELEHAIEVTGKVAGAPYPDGMGN